MEKKKLNLETTLKKGNNWNVAPKFIKRTGYVRLSTFTGIKKKKFWIIYYFRRFYVSDSLSFKW